MVSSEIRLVELPDGNQIWVRVISEGPTDVGDREAFPSFDSDQFMRTVSGVAHTVRSAVASAKPDTVTVEFGIEISAKAGKLISVLADIGGSTSLKISLGWVSTPSDQQSHVAP